ncbi:MAG: efflux RND transporter periplasmic adaptor subunit [Bacteroidales bacterium]|nr:efflux RND transporter periplasmic adaptor subunit [Bacteroidales bacterium]
MKSKKLLLIIAAVAVLLIIVLAIGKKLGWFGNEGYMKVAVQKGIEREIVELITANGKIQPETEVAISPDVSGEIVDLVIREGDEVKKGQYLLKIKPEAYQMARNRAEASLNSSKARLKQAESQLEMATLDYKRNSRLYEERAISEAEFEQSLTTYNTSLAEKEAAEFSVESAKATLDEADESLLKTSIYAPMSGTISRLAVELGERVVGTSMMAGTEMLRIANLNRMEVEVEVNENDIVRVANHDTALIEVDAYPDTRFKGVVSEIPVSANTFGVTTDQVTNFMVKILLLPESYADKISETNPYPLRPGMSATADIQTERKTGIYSVPIQAVTTRMDTLGAELPPKSEEQRTDMVSSDGTVSSTTETIPVAPGSDEPVVVVFTVSEGKAWMKRVKTGIQDNSYIEITEGLDLEDEVVIAPYSAISRQLKNDLSVEVVSEEDLFKGDKKNND